MTVLVLEGVSDSLIESLGDCRVRHAGCLSSAVAALNGGRPEVILASADVGWQRLFVGGIPEERRPAVLAQGSALEVHASWADDWVSDGVGPGELEVRLRLACERASQRRQRARRALVDTLTRLPNRRAIIRALVREGARVRRGRSRLALVLIDLDGFKRINDEHGHAEGDRVLRRVGGALLQVTREDELCGRIGGDEFAIVVGGGVEAASHAAARAVEALQSVGAAATVAVGELRPCEPLRTLYRRVDDQLRARKNVRRALRSFSQREAIR